MKILMIIDVLAKGGKERRMLELIRELTKQNGAYEICLIALSDAVEYKYVYELPIRFEILTRKYKKDISIVFKLSRIIREFKPDIIHSWGSMSSVYVVASRLFRKIPLIGVIADAPVNLTLSDKEYSRVKLTSPFSTLFVSNSNAGIKAYKIPLNKAICIYNGIDFGRFENLRSKEEVEKEFWAEGKGDKFIVTMVAAFEKRKDYPTLIQAAKQVCVANKQIYFLLIGDGLDRQEIEEQVPADMRGKQILFLGKRDDIESVLQICDVGVLITFTEGISNSIIEYMASGKPVVATRGGGTDEIVIDGSNGILIDPMNAGQIVENINKLYTDRDLVKRMGEKGYAFVREKFDVRKVTRLYIDIYHKLQSKSKY